MTQTNGRFQQNMASIDNNFQHHMALTNDTLLYCI